MVGEMHAEREREPVEIETAGERKRWRNRESFKGDILRLAVIKQSQHK